MENNLLISDNWDDFELIDSGFNARLERWGDIFLVRPDPQAVWARSDNPLWKEADAVYNRSSQGGGEWTFYNDDIPESWIIGYRSMNFKVRPTGFKHTGLFPEQAVNWDYIASKTRENKIADTLNLFGYTGGASIAAAIAGSKVCHVDASKGAVNWCKENSHLSHVKEDKIRLIVDDCMKFILREGRRDKKYDAIIMDPPAFGRGAGGEVWKLQDNLWEFLTACKELLSDKKSYVLINSYTTGLSPLALFNIAKDSFSDILTDTSSVVTGEIGLPFRSGERVMPCGIYCRVEF